MPHSIHLRRNADFPHPCELPGELSGLLADGDVAQIRDCKVRSGRQLVTLDQIFTIKDGDSTAEPTVVFQGDLINIHGIGRGWTCGELRIEGTAGDCVGELMQGGSIGVAGDVGDCLGRGMKAGRIVVEGNAGDYVGAEAPGETRGMTDGEICIRGDAGSYCGSRMRRGTIVIGGNVGPHLADLMLAGTIVCLGAITGPVGVGMKRGTIVLLCEPAAESLLVFDKAVTYQPVFLRVLFRHLRSTGFLLEAANADPLTFVRYLGDATAGQRAEILVSA